MSQLRTRFLISRLRMLLVNIAEGLRGKFPPCCIINFAIDEFRNGADVHKRYISGIGHGGYVPCVLCFRARKQTYQRAVTEMFLDSGYLDDCDYSLLPEHIKPLVFNPPITT